MAEPATTHTSAHGDARQLTIDKFAPGFIVHGRLLSLTRRVGQNRDKQQQEYVDALLLIGAAGTLRVAIGSPLEARALFGLEAPWQPDDDGAAPYVAFSATVFLNTPADGKPYLRWSARTRN